jgi:hypothetical protein
LWKEEDVMFNAMKYELLEASEKLTTGDAL